MDRFKDVKPPIDVSRPTRKSRLLAALQNNEFRYIQQLDTASDSYRALNSIWDRNKTMAIHLAAEHGSFETLAYLLEKFPEQLNQKDRSGKTPLFCAATQGHLRIVQYLINKRADLNPLVDDPETTTSGLTPIISAMSCKHHPVVRVLFKAMALTPQLLEQPESYWIALQWATEQNNASMLTCLLSISAFDSLEIRKQVQLMSVAAQKSGLEVIREFALKNRSLLTLADMNGYTPVFFASCRGDVALLRYLIEEGVDLNQVCEQPGHPDCGKPLYLLAHERKHYAAANLIIHALLNEQNRNTIFNFITTGEAALEYVLLSPINAQLIMKNIRLMTLIQEVGAQISSSSIGFYKTASSRRLSFFADISCETGESEVFTPIRVLGEGANSVVRYFVNSKKNKRVAIKAPKLNWLASDNIDETVDIATREMAFIRNAYSLRDPRLSQVYSIRRQNPEGINEFTLRCVMKYAGDHSLADVLKCEQSNQALAELFLVMSAALISLHEKGIVHGDVKESNVVVSRVNNQCAMVFVDFEHAYYLTDAHATVDQTGSYWAPERRVAQGGPVPNENQDVYSFAMMLQRFVQHHPKGPMLSYLFPSILAFSERGRDPTPEKRPTLRAFYKCLKEELSAQRSAIDEGAFSEVEEEAYNAIML